MTVAEAIEQLKKCKQDARFMFVAPNDGLAQIELICSGENNVWAWGFLDKDSTSEYKVR